MRILVVDDNQDGALLMGQLLTIKKHQVRVAFNGATAVKDAVLFSPQVILLDIGMSGIDGYETCRLLRTLLTGPVRIIALTGWGSVEDRHRSQEAGFDEHLVKPVDWNVLDPLLQRIEQVMSESSGPAPRSA